MDERFLQILRCPLTGETLTPADPQTLQRASEAQLAGRLRDRQGLEVDAFETGLVDAQRRWFYPVRNDIPSLIPDQAVAVDSFDAESAAPPDSISEENA